jgi:hypothetical protein
MTGYETVQEWPFQGPSSAGSEEAPGFTPGQVNRFRLRLNELTHRGVLSVQLCLAVCSGSIVLKHTRIDGHPEEHHDACMRTTLTLDPDVAAKAKQGAARLHKPFKEVINAALRVGLDEILAPPVAKPYRTKPRPLGLRRGFSYDNISELIAASEGEDHP